MRLSRWFAAFLIFPTSLVGQVSPPSSVPFAGSWIAPVSTTGITGAIISQVGSDWVVDLLGSCQPTDCQWPRGSLMLFQESFQSKTFGRGVATWDGSSGLTYAILSGDAASLTIDVYTSFRDNSGRPNLHTTNHLIRRQTDSATPTARPPANQPGFTTVEEAVIAAYEREFGERIRYPAIYQHDPQAVNCTGEGHLTTTAYLKASPTTSTVLSMYLSADGTVVRRKARYPALTPVGIFRVLVVLIRYPETVGQDALSRWEDAQKQINDDHASFAKRRGYTAPIVVFDNNNILLDPGQIDDPQNALSVRAAAVRRGILTANYQVVMTIDLNPHAAVGGSSGAGFVYMGNFARWKAPLDVEAWQQVANAAYHHEIAHLWGWPATHDWAPKCGDARPDHAPFVVPPMLFGWEDLEGDHVPEILRANPYRRLP